MVSASRRTSPTDDAEIVADRLHAAALRLIRRLRAHDLALGLSPPRLSALSILAHEGPLPIGALAEAEEVAAPTMTRLVDGLERQGLVRRGADPSDARGVLVTATPKGRKLLTSARSRRVRELALELAKLPAEELAVLRRGAELIAEVVREP